MSVSKNQICRDMLFYIVPLMCVFFKLSGPAGAGCSPARDGFAGN